METTITWRKQPKKSYQNWMKDVCGDVCGVHTPINHESWQSNANEEMPETIAFAIIKTTLSSVKIMLRLWAV